MNCSNWEAWLKWTEGLPTAPTYLEWSYYAMISAALQRRVWFGDNHSPLYPNLFIIPVGNPSSGKSVATKAAMDLLKEVKHVKAAGRVVTAIPQISGSFNPAMATGEKESLAAFPMSPSSCTFSRLVSLMALSSRCVAGANYLYYPMLVYLDELTSLFTENTADVVDFLNEVFMGNSYGKGTQIRGDIALNNPLITLVGCTTMENFRGLMTKEILGSGFVARTIIVHSEEEAYRTCIIDDRTPEQLAARDHLVQFLTKLSYLYGPIRFSPEAKIHANNWWQNRRVVEVNSAPVLATYNQRKNIHMQKLAAVLHFAEGHGLEVPLSVKTVDRATEILAKVEQNMHVPFLGSGRNYLSLVGQRFMEYIRSKGGRVPATDIHRFSGDATVKELNEVLQMLGGSGQLTAATDGGILYYVANYTKNGYP